MATLPCHNEACKSFGKPHPNCTCYGEMAEGGEAKHFCDETRSHKKECEYFADGGEALPKSFDELPTEDKAQVLPASFEELPTSAHPQELPDNFDELPKDEGTLKHQTGLQKLATVAEGAGEGYLGPLVPAVELGLSKLGVPGVGPEEMKAREEANPGLHSAGQAAGLIGAVATPGLGVFGLAGKIAEGATALSGLEAASLGASAIKGALQAGLLQTGDNLTDSMLGKGDPTDAVGYSQAGGIAKTASAAGLGALIGVAGGGLSRGLAKLAESNVGSKMQAFLGGIGEAAKGLSADESELRSVSPRAYDAGQRWYQNRLLLLGAGAGTYALHDVKKGVEEGNIEEGLQNAARDLAVGTGVSLGSKVIGKLAGPALLKAIGDGANPNQIFQIIDHANQVDSGLQSVNNAVNNLFLLGGQKKGTDYIPPAIEEGKGMLSSTYDKVSRLVHDWLSNGGADQDVQQEMYNQNSSAPQVQTVGYAKGGEVKPREFDSPGVKRSTGLEHVYPEQNMLLQATKGRISNHLRGLMPQNNGPKLAFDDPPDARDIKREYHRAMKVAIHPLSVLDEIKSGTIEPAHIQHLNAMYPELGNVLQKKITERITEAQMKGEKPSFKVRQGLSLMLGAPLSHEFTPQAMQAAQAVFHVPQPQPQSPPQQGQATKKKKNTAPLSKSDQSFLTNAQARAERQQSTKV